MSVGGQQDAATDDLFPLRAECEVGLGLRAQSLPLSLVSSGSETSRFSDQIFQLIECE